MFEVLVQAEKALASGALDQAERSYWQLIVLDPTNAIAVAGLARVSLERGDRRLARTFAERALVIDPDSSAAKRIIETLEGRGVKPRASDEPDLPLLAAQLLEALGRRRATGHKGADTHAPVPVPAPAPVPVPVPAPEARPPKGRKTAPEQTPKPLPQRPVEPLPERRQAGRQAATAANAAAAAEAAPRPQAPRPQAPRPQAPRGARAHRALGDRARRHRPPEAMKPPPRSEEPFAVAESAAALEAVDEAGDIVIAHPFEPTEGGAQTDELGQVLGAVGATDEDESIAMRVALVPDAAQLEAAELDAATPGVAEPQTTEKREPELNEAELEAAKVLTAESVGPAPSRRIDLVAPEATLAQRVSEQIAEAEFEAAELDASGAPIERPTRPAPRPATAQEATEEDAEAAALREALAIVLGSDTGDAPTEDGERAPHGAETTAAQPSADDDNEPPAEASDGGGDTAGSEATPQRHRHGLLRRLLGG